MKKESLTFLLSSAVAFTLLAMGMIPVFALTTTVLPTFLNGEHTTNGSGCTSMKCKSTFNGDGVNFLYADASDNDLGADGPNQSWTRTNHKSGSITYAPTHTTSVSTVGLAADIDFNGAITYGTGSNVDHELGPELYLKSGGVWMGVKSCLFQIEGGDPMTGSLTQKCTSTIAGTNKEYRIGATQTSSAWSSWLGPDTISDFWNGAHFSQIEKMEICDNSC